MSAISSFYSTLDDTTMSAAVASTALVTEDAFHAAKQAARLTRIHRHILWAFAPESQCFPIPEAAKAHKWHPIAAHTTPAELQARAATGSRAYLITEEQQDLLGNRYTTKGEPMEPNWQPEGPCLLRTAGNPEHWIPVHRIIPDQFMAPIAITDAPIPTGWTQPTKPHYLEESDIWVHFTPAHGPFNITHVTSRFQAPRHTTPAMRTFLGDKLPGTPSAADMTSATIAYIYVHKLIDTRTGIVSPDERLAALLGITRTFDITELQELLTPHYGEFV